jgi:hypothetical protein
LRSMQTGQNSIAPENSLPQIEQMRRDSVFMDLTVLPRGLKLRKEHGFPRQPAAARIGNQVPGSEPPAIPSSTEPCEPAGALCWQAVVQLQLWPPVGEPWNYHMQSEFGISHFFYSAEGHEPPAPERGPKRSLFMKLTYVAP